MSLCKISVFLISLTLVKSTVGQSRPKAVITFTPNDPILNSEVKIGCQVESAEITRIFLSPQPKGNNDNVGTISWDIKSNKVNFQAASWKKRDDVKISTDFKKNMLSIKFIATLKDAIAYNCMTFHPSFNLIQAFRELKVRSPPTVVSLGLVPKPIDGKPDRKIIPGEKREVKCIVRKSSQSNSKINMKFTAPGNGSEKFRGVRVTTGPDYVDTEYLLDRVFDFKDNGRTIFCSATNDAGTSSKTFALNITYGTRNTALSVSKGANVSVGDEISCKSEGNPVPNVQITVSGYSKKDISWASKGATGAGNAYLFIPHKATLGRYTIACNASNVFKIEVAKAVAINVVAASYASAGVIGGIILGLIVLVILVAIICFVVQRRQNETAKQESQAGARNSRNEYQPVSTKPSEQQGAAELEKDTGPYDIDAHDNKSGSQGGAYAGDRNQQATDLFVPSSGGSNGKQQFLERRDEGIDDETALNEPPLTYASLEFDETPRSRVPIVFKDNEKVEYSEIMSTPTYNNTYDDEHYYENVRHNVV